MFSFSPRVFEVLLLVLDEGDAFEISVATRLLRAKCVDDLTARSHDGTLDLLELASAQKVANGAIVQELNDFRARSKKPSDGNQRKHNIDKRSGMSGTKGPTFTYLHHLQNEATQVKTIMTSDLLVTPANRGHQSEDNYDSLVTPAIRGHQSEENSDIRLTGNTAMVCNVCFIFPTQELRNKFVGAIFSRLSIHLQYELVGLLEHTLFLKTQLERQETNAAEPTRRRVRRTMKPLDRQLVILILLSKRNWVRICTFRFADAAVLEPHHKSATVTGATALGRKTSRAAGT
jgi:hypothetical protein